MKIWYEVEEESLHVDGECQLTLLKHSDYCIKIENNNFPKNLKLNVEFFNFYNITNTFKHKFKAWWTATKFIFKK